MTKITRYGLVAFFLTLGAVLIWANRHAPTTPVLLGGVGSCILGALIADPADVKSALGTVVSALPIRRGGSGEGP